MLLPVLVAEVAAHEPLVQEALLHRQLDAVVGRVPVGAVLPDLSGRNGRPREIVDRNAEGAPVGERPVDRSAGRAPRLSGRAESEVRRGEPHARNR